MTAAIEEFPDVSKADVKGRTVLVRADLNVPMRNGAVTDATRIARFAPTITSLLDRGARVVVMTHLGRPAAEPNPVYSTRPVANALSKVLKQDVCFVSDCVGAPAERAVGGLPPGGVAILENLRFHKGESENNRNFAIRLSVLGDLYVNDAFSCSHRAHASTHAIAELMPAYAGPSLLAEITALRAVLEKPRRPVMAVVGGAKVSSKIAVLKSLAGKVDHLVIGGGMANTFLAARGLNVGRSLVEPDALGTALEITEAAQAAGCRILLPEDVVVAETFAAHSPSRIARSTQIPVNAMALDIGPASAARIRDLMQTCATLLWNGPLGAFELAPFGEGTFAVAQAAARMTAQGQLTSIGGGGDTVAALNAAGVADQFTYVSTAGGAFLEWLEGRALPGIEILRTATRKLEEV